MALKFNSRVLTPLLFLNYLTAEDYIMTKLKERTNIYSELKTTYEESVKKYAIDDQEDATSSKTLASSAQLPIVSDVKPKNLNETIQDSVKNAEVSHSYIASLKQLIYNNLHENLPIIYPLVTVGSFFAPVLMTRTCELFIYSRIGFFLYDLYALKSKGEVSQKSEDVLFGCSTVAIFALTAFTSIMPIYRFASMNVHTIKAAANKELMLVEAAKKQMQNLK